MVNPIEFIHIADLDDEKKMYAFRRKIDYMSAQMNNVGAANGSYAYKSRIAYCRSLYNDKIDEQNYAHAVRATTLKTQDEQGNIISEIEATMPAKVRHIPIVRPKTQALLSKHRARPLVPQVIAIDEDTVERKQERLKDKILESIHSGIESRLAANDYLKEAISLQEQALQQKSLEMQQGGQPDPLLEKIISEAGEQISRLRQILENKQGLSIEEHKKIAAHFGKTYKDLKELICEKALQYEIDIKDLKSIFNRGLKEQFITDETIYYVEYDPISKRIETENVFPENFIYQISEGNNFIDEADWCVRRRQMTLGDIRAYFSELQKEDISQLYFQSNGANDALYNNTLFGLLGASQWDIINQIVNGNVSGRDESIAVFECYWKERVPVYFLAKMDKSKYDKAQDTLEILDVLTKEEADKISPKTHKKNGTQIILRYRNDLYKGFRIGLNTSSNLYFRCGKVEHAPRRYDNMGDVMLPFIGYAYSGMVEPLSIIWSTKELQETYNLLQYQKEALWMLSGSRGFMYDLAQKPAEYSLQEIMYYRRLGLGLFRSTDEDGNPKSYNQFGTYDDTPPSTIAILDDSQMSIMNIISSITGITDQEVGQIDTREQVGNTKLAIQQSANVTEYYMIRASILETKVLETIANLIPIAYSDGKRAQYLLGDEQKILTIPAGELEGAFFRIRVKNAENQRMLLNVMREMGQQMVLSQQITGSQYVKLIGLETISEMEDLLKHYENLFQQSLAAKEKGNAEMQQQILQQEQQHEQQMLALKAKIESETLMLKAKLEAEKEQAAKVRAQEEMKLKAQMDLGKAQMQEDTKKYAIDKEASVELQFLELEQRKAASEAAIQSAQLSLQDMQTKLSFQQKLFEIKSKSKEKVKD